jgi:hypothetical protein
MSVFIICACKWKYKNILFNQKNLVIDKVNILSIISIKINDYII